MLRGLALGCLLVLGGCHLLFPFDAASPADDAAFDAAVVAAESGPDAPAAIDGPVGENVIMPDCSPLGYQSLLEQNNGAGDWTVALNRQTTYKNLTVNNTDAQDAAATADLNNSGVQVAGFIVNLAVAGGIDEVTASMVKLIINVLDVQGISPGRRITTHDGFTAAVDTTFPIHHAAATRLSDLRDAVRAAVLRKPVSGLPLPWGVQGQDFVLRLSVVLRSGGRAVVLGAVTASAADADTSKSTRSIAQDLTSTTGLAQKGATIGSTCPSQTITQPLAPVDIIWVIDESGSMLEERKLIGNNAASIFGLAQSYGLDFRMGVTNSCNPGNSSCPQGYFCSKVSSDSKDSGGIDRFLLPSEQSIFASCIHNPPGYTSDGEYGLQNAEQALKHHLPRTASSPQKIRPGAKLAIITVTDEVPEGLDEQVKLPDQSVCTLAQSTQVEVNSALLPYLNYFSGYLDLQAMVSVYHVIGGTCGNPCSAQVAHGYKELAIALNGSLQDVCSTNLLAGMTKTLKAIKIAASGIQLQHAPIGASLRVAINLQGLPRSVISGFTYDPFQRSVVFTGATAPQKNDIVTVSYRYWK